MLETSPWEEGLPDRPILVLAEAPSNAEIRLEQPLVGPSGTVFNDCLHTSGLHRSECYILNVWPFQVEKDRLAPDNIYVRGKVRNFNYLLYTKRGFTELGFYEARHCIEKLKAATPNVVLSLGNVAFHMLSGDNRPILTWRGSPLWSDKFQKKYIPTVHPAATLHGVYIWRYLIINDMEKVRRQMDFPELVPTSRNIIINPSYEDARDYLWETGTKKRFATDIEVINHQLNCFCICHDKSEVMVIPMADEFGNSWWNEEQETHIWTLYAQLMGDKQIAKINQNLIGFDVPFLLQQNNIFTCGPLYDTMIAQKILYPDFKKGLDFITSVHTDEPYYKAEGKMWKGHGGDISQFWRYNGKDGYVALEAWDKLADEMTEGGYWPTYNRRVRLAQPLQYMTIRGMKVDHKALQTTADAVDIKIEEKMSELHRVAKQPFNPSSPKQCQEYFYGLLAIPPYKSSTGTVTTDDKAMARIYRRYHHPEAKLVQEIRALKKLKGTYLEVEFDKDDRLRCSWDPTGTWTGRLSSSQTIFGTGMNQQNLHPEFKHFLVADDD